MELPPTVSHHWQDFKKFALKGSLIDLAVAVIIGGAFSRVVDSLVKNVLMQLLTYITPSLETYRSWKLGKVEIGAFLAELINFLLLAVVLYLFVVKLLGALRRAAWSAAPTTKNCPFCAMEVPAKAIKCGHCTADLPAGPAPIG